MNSAVRRKRLLLLADYLENLPRNVSFNMAVWGAHDASHEPDEHNFCGTAACALGHATQIPQFKKAGLTAKWRELSNPVSLRIYSDNAKLPVKYAMDVYFGEEEGEEAGAKFFGLSHSEANNIFLAIKDDKDTVIQKLRKAAEQPYVKDADEWRD